MLEDGFLGLHGRCPLVGPGIPDFPLPTGLVLAGDALSASPVGLLPPLTPTLDPERIALWTEKG